MFKRRWQASEWTVAVLIATTAVLLICFGTGLWKAL